LEAWTDIRVGDDVVDDDYAAAAGALQCREVEV
jgi:hypothetical protein